MQLLLGHIFLLPQSLIQWLVLEQLPQYLLLQQQVGFLEKKNHLLKIVESIITSVFCFNSPLWFCHWKYLEEEDVAVFFVIFEERSSSPRGLLVPTVYGLSRVETFNGCWLRLNYCKITQWTLLKAVWNAMFLCFHQAKSPLTLCTGLREAQDEVNNC